jgi:hypothetical protein
MELSTTNQTCVNRWIKFAGLMLIAVTVFIVVAPDLDLPPTLTKSSSIYHKDVHVVVGAIVPAGIALALHSSSGAPLLVISSNYSEGVTSLIDLNCTRLC